MSGNGVNTVEDKTRNKENIKAFFSKMKKINGEYITGIRIVTALFTLFSVMITALPVDVRDLRDPGLICVLYLPSMMAVFCMRQYIYAGNYADNSVQAKVQNIYSVIKYTPFDAAEMRKEKIRRLVVFLLKVTAAGAVVQLITFFAEKENYSAVRAFMMFAVLFVWPLICGIWYIIYTEKSAADSGERRQMW